MTARIAFELLVVAIPRYIRIHIGLIFSSLVPGVVSANVGASVVEVYL